MEFDFIIKNVNSTVIKLGAWKTIITTWGSYKDIIVCINKQPLLWNINVSVIAITLAIMCNITVDRKQRRAVQLRTFITVHISNNLTS